MVILYLVVFYMFYEDIMNILVECLCLMSLGIIWLLIVIVFVIMKRLVFEMKMVIFDFKYIYYYIDSLIL